MEKTNIRYVVPEDIGCAVDFVSIDVSFISLTKVLVPVKELMAERGQIVCLIKPQFEAGREKVGKKGVVREKETHMEVVRMVMDFALSIGFGVLGLAFSPIKGPEGNIEYLLYLQKPDSVTAPHPDAQPLPDRHPVPVSLSLPRRKSLCSQNTGRNEESFPLHPPVLLNCWSLPPASFHLLYSAPGISGRLFYKALLYSRFHMPSDSNSL